ncbi:hypothetical protein RFI_15601, partial [Reticulomyxa filosa]
IFNFPKEQNGTNKNNNDNNNNNKKGDNYFSGKSDYVYVDSNDSLHVTITYDPNTSIPYCTQFKNFDSLGHGLFFFFLHVVVEYEYYSFRHCRLLIIIERSSIDNDPLPKLLLSLSVFDGTGDALNGNSAMDMTTTNWGYNNINMSSGYDVTSNSYYYTQELYTLPKLSD